MLYCCVSSISEFPEVEIVNWTLWNNAWWFQFKFVRLFSGSVDFVKCAWWAGFENYGNLWSCGLHFSIKTNDDRNHIIMLFIIQAITKTLIKDTLVFFTEQRNDKVSPITLSSITFLPQTTPLSIMLDLLVRFNILHSLFISFNSWIINCKVLQLATYV